MNSSPPHTPHGSLRSTAPARHAGRIGQSLHSDLASSTSSGDSAKNKSGSPAHGNARLLAVPVSPAGLATIATGAGLVIAVTRTNSASAAAASSMTAAVPGRYIGVIPSHLLVCIVVVWSDKLRPRMTKAADPMLWVRGLWGSWPVWLDRIPGRMRTQCTTTNGGDTGRTGVLLLADALLRGGIRLASRMGGVAEAHGARLRSQARDDGRSSRPGGDRRLGTPTGNGRAAADERGTRAGPRARWHRGIGRPDVAQHSGHLLLSCSITRPPC